MSTPAQDVTLSTPNGTRKAKANPRPNPNKRLETLEAEVTELRRELDETRWCFAEWMYKMKMAAVQQLMQRPEVQDRIQQLLMQRIDGLSTQTPPQ